MEIWVYSDFTGRYFSVVGRANYDNLSNLLPDCESKQLLKTLFLFFLRKNLF